MFTKNLFPVSIFLFVSVLFFSCKKEATEMPFAELNFQVVNVTNGFYHCTWNAPNISTYKNYYIVHSPFILGIDDDPKSIYFKRRTIISGQTRDDEILFVRNNYGLTLYFQLFIDIGDRYVRSNVVSFETPNSETIDTDAVSALHYPNKNAIYISNFGLRGLNYYDEDEKIIKEKTELDFNFRATTAQVGNNGFGDEIYAIDGNELVIFNAETLEEKDRYTASGVIYSVATNDNGLIAITVRNSSKKIQILARENLTIINNLASSNLYDESRGVAFLSKENNELVEIGRDSMTYFKLDENGMQEESNSESNPFSDAAARGQIIVSSSGNFYVNSRKGHVFDSDLNGIVELYLLSGNYYYYSNYFFNKEETFLYAIPSGSERFIDKFSIPNFELVDRKEFVNGIPLELFYRDDEIQVVIFTNDFNCTYIQPLNF
ncbi:MAG: hypothetical protein AB8H03_25445 [Saprospiraceae bacterium]